MSGTVDVVDGLASLHHRAVADYLVSDSANSPLPLGVSLPAARLTMADHVMKWLGPVIVDDQTADNGTDTSLTVIFVEGLLRRAQTAECKESRS